MGIMALHGMVIRLEPEHGFGFIRDDREGDWFFVAAGVRNGGLGGVSVGERVAFAQEWTPRGPRATDIRAESTE
jgi:cold shock CspA family protein